ncbi:MAG: phosphate ABC transporter substrate-binding protein PstS [Beijerinckiaceae bacterium]
MLRCVQKFVSAAAVLCFLAFPALAEPVRGAGSTFAFPVIAKWSQDFLRERAGGNDFVAADNGVDYEPVGSLAGVMRLTQPEMDFAVTDVPLSTEELRRRGLVQFPIVMGGIAIVTNIDGIKAGQLRLSGPLLADILQGKIQNWDDAAIKSLNPSLALPNQKITVVHRSDGSGTTFNLTRYLSIVSDEWKTKLGFDTQVKWPVGTGAEGGTGMVRALQRTAGSIGYVEYGQVSRSGLAYSLIQNRAGQFVKPEMASLQAAALNADWAGSVDFNLFIGNAPGADAYPLAATAFALMHRDARSSARTRRALIFFQHSLDNGSSVASGLGYVPLPNSLTTQVKTYWQNSFGAAARF